MTMQTARHPAMRFSGICLTCIALGACALDREEALSLTLENINRHDRGASSVSISPDGSRIAIVGTGPSGSGAYLLETEDRGSQPAFWMPSGPLRWSPDSRSVAFVRDGDIWLARVPSGEPRRLTSGMGDAREPAFSPDGGTVAFYSGKGGAQDIWLVPADGSDAARQLTREAAAPDDPRFTPAWSPDGATIAYVSNGADYWADDVWLVDVVTAEARQLSRSLMASSSPVWSPDGERIAIFGTAKFLIMHGELDRRAPYQQSEELVAALRSRGNPVEFHSYPDEGHGFRRPENRVHAYGRLLAFFQQHLAPRPASEEDR
ncbi:MAG: prolyl oligopeptidase family serine peptidase [Gammaproteobacteria bacterium]|nr:prolyl oligopeptidase family serine peptidase [Gammaproteobacteria bacterium]